MKKDNIRYEKSSHAPEGRTSGQPVQAAEVMKSGVRQLLRQIGNAETQKSAQDQIEPQLAQAVNQERYSVGDRSGGQDEPDCFLDGKGKIVAEGKIPTRSEEFRAYFSAIPKARLALEVGTHSAWVSDLLQYLG